MLKNRWLTLLVLTFASCILQSAKNDLQINLFNAVLNGDKEQVQALLNQGADPNIKKYKLIVRPFSPIKKENILINLGVEPLQVAAERGDAEIVEMLLNKGANPNTVSNDGNTPLHMAVVRKHPEITKILIDKGASLDTQNKLGYTPSDLAWDEEIVQILLDKGASPDIFNKPEAKALRQSPAFQKLMYYREQALKKEHEKSVKNMSLATVNHTFDTVYKEKYAKHLKDKFMILKNIS